MERPSVYPYNNIDPPGVNVHRLREEIGWSLRQLADECRPPLDHTTIGRLEQNNGYTQDTLERVAVALSRGLGKKVAVSDLFLPAELAPWAGFTERERRRLAELVDDIAAANRYRSKKN